MKDEVKELAGIELPDYEVDDEMKLEVGVSYTGSFKISRNGLIKVRPYKKGTKPTNLRKLVDGEQHAIFASKNLLRIVITLPKQGESNIIRKRFQNVVVECYKDLSELEL